MAKTARRSTAGTMYVPKDGRRPFRRDPWWVIVKRVKAGQRLREILWGGIPPKIPTKCSTAWGFLIREFVSHRTFRYSTLMVEARKLVESRGGPWVLPADVDVTNPEAVRAVDLEVEKAFQDHMQALREQLPADSAAIEWLSSPETRFEALIDGTAKELALQGICVVCAGGLPCTLCGMPKVEPDGQGGLRELPMPPPKSEAV
jgi:hypothetical protein